MTAREPSTKRGTPRMKSPMPLLTLLREGRLRTVKINPHGRLTFAGKTGRGKTGLSRNILHRMARSAEAHQNRTFRIFILATKPIPANKEQDFASEYFPGTSYSEFTRLEDMAKSTGRVVVWKPQEQEGQRTPEHYAEFFRQVFFLGKPAQVFIDELGELTQGLSARRVPRYYHSMYTQGRGLDIGISSGIQDPVFIPREILTQADIIHVMQLQGEPDRKKLAASFGKQLLIPVPDKHGVYVVNTEESQIKYYNDWHRYVDGERESPAPMLL